MEMPLADRQTVLDAYGQGASKYVLDYVGRCVEDRWGAHEARRFNNGLLELTHKFKSFKTAGVPLCDDADIEAVSMSAAESHDLLTPYFVSALAFQCYRRGDGPMALHLLRVAQRCDERLISNDGVEAFYPHLLQSGHNICRVLVGERRRYEATLGVREMILSLLRLLETEEPRLAVSLELMGFQLVSYLVGLAQKGRISDDCANWELDDLPPSHSLANVRLWRAIRNGDACDIAQKLSDRNILYFGVLKTPALEVLSRWAGGKLNA